MKMTAGTARRQGRVSALLPLLDDVRHHLRRGASHLPARRSRQNVNLFLREPLVPHRSARFASAGSLKLHDDFLLSAQVAREPDPFFLLVEICVVAAVESHLGVGPLLRMAEPQINPSG